MSDARDRIAPSPSWPTIVNPFGSAAEAFEAGNYPLALDMAAEGSELRAASLVMCGAIAPGLAALQKFESPRARLIRAYAHWCLNEADQARSLLREIGRTEFGPVAEKFGALLDGPIDVVILSMPDDAKRRTYAGISGIRTHWIQLDADEFGISMKDALAVAVPDGVRPRLLLSLDAYGPYLPTAPKEPGLPLAFWTGDHDYFFATRHADLARADITLANSAAEQIELSRHYAARAAAIPTYETYQQERTNSVDSERDLDIFYTGRAFTPYMRDKAQFLFRIATLDSPELKIDMREGYLPIEDYQSALRRAKFVPIFWRSAGGIQTRAIEAMRSGASVLSPERTITRPLLGDAAALYRSAIEADIAAMLDDRRPSGRSVAHDLDALFWPSPAREERLLKFCLFQALLAPKQIEVEEPTYVPVELRGYGVERGIKVYTRLARLNGSVEAPATTHFLYAAAAAFYATILLAGNPAGQNVGQMALDFYRAGIEAHPSSLALRFNGARVLWTFGQRAEALQQFRTIVDQLPDLDFDPLTDSLLSHRIRTLAEMFPYGDFFQAIVEPPAHQGRLRGPGPREFIASAALAYIAADLIERAEWSASVGILRRALERCPVNIAGWRLMTQALAKSGAQPATIREAFYRTVNLYPAELFNLLPFGIEAELADGRTAEATEILRKWILVRARMRDPSGKPIPVTDESLAAARKHRNLLNDWTAALFDRIVDAG